MKRCLQGNECIEYEKFIKQNNLYKESKIQSLFSGITKSYSSGTCKFCKTENTIKSQTYFIKLPDILIFTLERNLGNPNKVPIIPNNTINMGQYLDKNLKIDSAEYELFAINMRLGSTINFGHEILSRKKKSNLV